MKDSFKKDLFLLDGKKAFTGRILGKIYIKNPFSLPEMKHSLKNAFPLYAETASSGKKIEENGFYKQENVFLLNMLPYNFNNGFQ